ncbi:hypothetical protein NY08_4627 [Rhodococcus sp. B7740]|nr:hypothetical protein NY08_4627 [Rhodococcus sp. B7740]
MRCHKTVTVPTVAAPDERSRPRSTRTNYAALPDVSTPTI